MAISGVKVTREFYSNPVEREEEKSMSEEKVQEMLTGILSYRNER
jgi:hypothetical protein